MDSIHLKAACVCFKMEVMPWQIDRKSGCTAKPASLAAPKGDLCE